MRQQTPTYTLLLRHAVVRAVVLALAAVVANIVRIAHTLALAVARIGIAIRKA